MRRKTLANNLSSKFGIAKDEVIKRIETAGFSSMVRGEVLTLEDYIALSHYFKD